MTKADDECSLKNWQVVLQKHGKTKQDIQDAYNYFTDWLLTQPHLKHIPAESINIGMATNGLINSKFNYEIVKERLDAYMSYRNTIPEVFNNWDPLSSDIQNTVRVCGWVTLPELNPNDLCKVVIFKILDPNPDNLIFWDQLKLMMMLTEVLGAKELANGIHIVFDVSNLKFGHFRKFTPSFVKKAYIVLSKMYGLRLFGIHILNSNKFAVKIINMVKCYMKTKLVKRIHIHEDLNSFHKCIPKELCPIEYGGPSLLYQDIWNNMVNNMTAERDQLLYNIQFRSMESKRVNTTECRVFEATHGTFRQLVID